MSKVLGMRCRECGEKYPVAPVHVCELCFGALEVEYDLEAIKAEFAHMNRRYRIFLSALSATHPQNF